MHPSEGTGRERGLQRAVLAGDEQADLGSFHGCSRCAGSGSSPEDEKK
jgi:hypothetical protein